MQNMTEAEIMEKVDSGKCNGAFFCTVATTCYEEEERRRICTACWKELDQMYKDKGEEL